MAGFDTVCSLLAVTLGPTQGAVLNALSAGSVEPLADAGEIARRVVEVPGRGRNTGAMMARHLAWRMHEAYGDGAATAATLAQAMVREGAKRIAAGVDPALVRSGLEQALPVAMEALSQAAMPAPDGDMLAGIASGITGDPALGAVLGEIVEILGPDAALTFEEYPVPYLDREYVEGAMWRAHPAARDMIAEGKGEVVLERPLIMLADQELNAFDDVRAALELANRPEEKRALLVVPVKIGNQALAALAMNLAQGTVTAVAARLSGSGTALSDDLGDLAAITGGEIFSAQLNRPARRARIENLGTARKVVLTRESLTIAGGGGQAGIIAERRASLRRRLERPDLAADEHKRLRERAARLGGGSAILKIGAHSKSELARMRAQAEKALIVLTGIVSDGIVPGGGVAFLAAIPAVSALRESCTVAGEEHGVAVMLAALEAPLLQLARNEGRVHPPTALAEVRRRGRGQGRDVRSGEYADLRARGILDSLRVTQGALRLATSMAVSVLTTGAIILPAAGKRERRVQP